MTKICLVFVFNHKFEKNIQKLEDYYGPRFSLRRYLMPFGRSTHPSVIPIIENGYTFSGHFAQGAPGFIAPDITHYVFVADDLVLNPRLNESNIIEALGLREGDSYIKSLAAADALRYRWHSSVNGAFDLLRPGFDYKSELPLAATAQQRFERMGIEFHPAHPSWAQWMWALKRAKDVPFWFIRLLALRGKQAQYPLLAGYADFVIVSQAAIQAFVFYCGVFAAMNTFAEIAIPTALALATEQIVTELTIGDHFSLPEARRRPEARMEGLELWDGAGERFAAQTRYDFSSLIAEFPADRLYVHPVKLSKWT